MITNDSSFLFLLYTSDLPLHQDRAFPPSSAHITCNVLFTFSSFQRVQFLVIFFLWFHQSPYFPILRRILRMAIAYSQYKYELHEQMLMVSSNLVHLHRPQCFDIPFSMFAMYSITDSSSISSPNPVEHLKQDKRQHLCIPVFTPIHKSIINH